MKDKMLFSLAVIPLSFYLVRTIPSPSIGALNLLTIIFCICVIMQVLLMDYNFKYGKAAKSRKIRKSTEGMLVKFNFSVLFLFLGVCMMFVYGRDSEWVRFAILLASGILAVLMAGYLDLDKGTFVFKGNRGEKR